MRNPGYLNGFATVTSKAGIFDISTDLPQNKEYIMKCRSRYVPTELLQMIHS